MCNNLGQAIVTIVSSSEIYLAKPVFSVTGVKAYALKLQCLKIKKRAGPLTQPANPTLLPGC